MEAPKSPDVVVRKKKRQKHPYFDKNIVTPALNEYHYARLKAEAEGTEPPVMPAVVAKAIEDIAQKYGNSKYYHINDEDRRDMIRCGVSLAYEKINTVYDPTKMKTNNCFSIITSFVNFGFLGYFSEERKGARSKASFLNAMADGQAFGSQPYDPRLNK